MTEQNQQNPGNRKKKTSKSESDNPSIFRHYKLLLHMCLREAFNAYWTKGFAFLKEPALKEMPDMEEFLPDFASGRYLKLVEEARKNPDLQRWYVISRVINARQVNQLAGTIRSYLQYVWDIQRRAKEIGNSIRKKPEEGMLTNLKKALEVLDVTVHITGAVTNTI